MTKYREILRLSALGLTLREISASLQLSQHTIIDVRTGASGAPEYSKKLLLKI